MKTYQGERTEFGCEVKVDGKPLRLRSDLSGAETTTFDWGQRGGRQLSLALLSDLLGNDDQAIRLCDVFEREVVSRLPYDTWIMTDSALSAALTSVERHPLHPTGDNGARPVSHVVQPPKNMREDVKSPAKPVAEPVSSSSKPAITHETIARLAYAIWEKNGRVTGRALNDWLEAEALARAKR